ncbi:FeoA family protein [Gordonia sp. DT30]|uniref:FeoA family protein n=1 Tax=unclassified Gordonia (in: high G+C Gram-positive bacteria) TaxID=2657482 RepID=UPI003CEB145E
MTNPEVGTTIGMNRLTVRESARVVGYVDSCPPQVRRRMVSLGFSPGATVTKVRRALLGDPCVYRVADYEMCLRAREAAHIECAVQS